MNLVHWPLAEVSKLDATEELFWPWTQWDCRVLLQYFPDFPYYVPYHVYIYIDMYTYVYIYIYIYVLYDIFFILHAFLFLYSQCAHCHYLSTQSIWFQSFMELWEFWEAWQLSCVFLMPRAWQVDLQWSWQRLAWRIIFFIFKLATSILVVGVSHFDFGAWRLWSSIPSSAKWTSSALGRGLAMQKATVPGSMHNATLLQPMPTKCN